MASYFNDYEMLMNADELELCNFCKYEDVDCPAEYDITEKSCIRQKKLQKIMEKFCDNLNKMIEQEQNAC